MRTMQRHVALMAICLSLISGFVAAAGPEETEQHHIASARHDRCIHEATLYKPSSMEKEWMEGVDVSQNAFCEHIQPYSAAINKWLDEARALSSSPKTTTMVAAASGQDTSTLSSFTHTYRCGAQRMDVTSYIEPLFGSLRHPLALCPAVNFTYMEDKEYLVLESATSIVQPKARHLLFDLGASLWNSGGGGASQSWMIDAYRKRGIEFQRILLWEAKTHSPADVLKDVPGDIIDAYQYFNIPASANASDPANPLNILKKIARPNDFVAVKLDIDNSPIEMAFISQILSDFEISRRIDELFFEHHVNFPMLTKCCWGGVHPDFAHTTLADSAKLFQLLRKKGIRAHGWP